MATEALTAQTRDRAAVINDPLGPLWYRGLVREPCTEAESRIDGAALTIEKNKDSRYSTVAWTQIVSPAIRNRPPFPPF